MAPSALCEGLRLGHLMFKVVTETLGVANVLRTPIYAATQPPTNTRYVQQQYGFFLHNDPLSVEDKVTRNYPPSPAQRLKL